MVNDKINLGELFPMPSEAIRTNGTQDGVILKFTSFYLKIYDALSKDAYIVEGYYYNNPTPIFNDQVPQKDMRQYARTVACIMRNT